MPLTCVVVGIAPPPDKVLVDAVKASAQTTCLRWRKGYAMALDYEDHVGCNQSDERIDDGGIPTMLLTTTIDEEEVTPNEVVALVDDFLQDPQNSSPFKVDLWASAGAPLPLRPLEGYETRIEIETKDPCLSTEDSLHKATRAMQEFGLVLQQQIMSTELVEEFRRVIHESIVTTEENLRTHRPSLRIGKDAFQFREIASRNQNRFDLRLDSVASTFASEAEATPPAVDLVYRLVKESPTLQRFLHEAMDLGGGSVGEIDVLNDDNALDFDVSVVYSRPGACAQGWHADGSHLPGAREAGWEMEEESQTIKNAQLAAPYAICLFVPLIDLDDDVGYTQFWPGSHAHRQLVGMGPVAHVTQSVWNSNQCKAGDGVLYDYRLMHQGMPHSAGSSVRIRPVLQIIFKQRWYTEKANYGREPIASLSQQVTG
ncbi:MAG: hypothetical protein SGILL_002445 [Bacillariaceae sp.]